MADDPFDFDKTGVTGEINYDTFGCNVFQESPPTPDRLRPDVEVWREVHNNGEKIAPDGAKIRFWAFLDPFGDAEASDKPFPAPLIRVRQGQVVHTHLKSRMNAHTIHHHGIEPTTFNDGVGHVSFEVGSEYTYQWYAAKPGTYFYHCHRNTVLHFEMGMYGPLIIDPPQGPGWLFENGPQYDIERIWVVDDVDPTWRNFEHDAGLCGEDVGLNIFRPKYFMINGVFAPKTATDPNISINARPGERILIRLINASYSILRCRLGVAATVHGCDGLELGGDGWCRPTAISANRWFELVTAQRYDLVLTAPSTPGTYRCQFQFLDWVSREIQDGGRGVMETRIVVA